MKSKVSVSKMATVAAIAAVLFLSVSEAAHAKKDGKVKKAPVPVLVPGLVALGAGLVLKRRADRKNSSDA